MHISEGRASPWIDTAGSEKEIDGNSASGNGGGRNGECTQQGRASQRDIQQMQTAGGRDVWIREKAPRGKVKRSHCKINKR